MNLFNRNNPDSQALPVFSEGTLKKRVATDKYMNNKRVEDALHAVISWAIYAVWILGLLAIAYFIYYFLISDQKDPATLLEYAKLVLAYIAGIVTPVVQKIIENKSHSQ